jgi:DNA-binding transcriptional regulator LsrR (DeoR family)
MSEDLNLAQASVVDFPHGADVEKPRTMANAAAERLGDYIRRIRNEKGLPFAG